MFRLLAVFAALSFAVPVAFADDEKKPDRKGKPDKGKLFTTMDADADGAVSKDEFTKGMEKVLDKMKEKAADKGGKAADRLEKAGGQLGGRVFDKLDADSDGKLTKEEFEKGEFAPGKLRDLLGKRKDK